jgi:hypothetical protein
VANPWADDSDDDSSEESASRKAFENVRDNVIFLIDVQPLMVRNPPESEGGGGGGDDDDDDDDDEGERASGLRIALEVAERMMKSKIMSSPDDKIGVVCFNAREMKNAHSFQNVHQLVPLDVPSAHHIEKVCELRASAVLGGGSSGGSESSTDGGPKFQADVGSVPPKGEKLSEGIWLAHHVSLFKFRVGCLFLSFFTNSVSHVVIDVMLVVVVVVVVVIVLVLDLDLDLVLVVASAVIVHVFLTFFPFLPPTSHRMMSKHILPPSPAAPSTDAAFTLSLLTVHWTLHALTLLADFDRCCARTRRCARKTPSACCSSRTMPTRSAPSRRTPLCNAR